MTKYSLTVADENGEHIIEMNQLGGYEVGEQLAAMLERMDTGHKDPSFDVKPWSRDYQVIIMIESE